jgi:hypothetical protein
MAKDAVATMGTILPVEVCGRDAVHVAVIAVRANSLMSPGNHVGFASNNDKNLPEPIVGHVMDTIGIVDPFLTAPVKRGEKFWLYLYPRTITSLRYNWTHPAFPDEVKTDGVYTTPSHKLESEVWMTNFAGQYNMFAHEMVEGARKWVLFGDSFCDGDTFEGESVPDEFWDHYENITGTKVPRNKKYSFFACSC